MRLTRAPVTTRPPRRSALRQWVMSAEALAPSLHPEPQEPRCTQGLRPSRPAEPTPPAVTRVIPQSDDGAVLYVQEPGSHVGRRSEHLTVRKDGRELTRVPIHAIRQVCVFGNVQVSTQALETLVTNEVPVCYLTGYGRFVGSFTPAPAKKIEPARPQ